MTSEIYKSKTADFTISSSLKSAELTISSSLKTAELTSKISLKTADLTLNISFKTADLTSRLLDYAELHAPVSCFDTPPRLTGTTSLILLNCLRSLISSLSKSSRKLGS